MRRITLMCVCTICLSWLNASAQIFNNLSDDVDSMVAVVSFDFSKGIKSVFIDMPEDMMPMIGENARKDLVDFIEYGMKATVENEWGGRTTLTKLTPNYLELQEDSRGCVVTQMMMLPMGRDTIVCMVRTLNTPVPDSEILFYNRQCEPMPAGKFFSAPKAKDFNTSSKTYTAIGSVEYMRLSLSPATSSDGTQPSGSILLTAALYCDETIADQLEAPRPDNAPTLTYVWDGQKFTLTH